MIQTIQLTRVPIMAGPQLSAWRPAYARPPVQAMRPAMAASVTPRMGQDGPPSSVMVPIGILGLVSSGVSAYHGYKRNNNSIGWAVWWGLLGFLFMPIPPIVAVAQGYGKRAKK